MNDAHKINIVSQLAQEAEIADPIDWGYLKIDETTAYKMMASHVVENFGNSAQHELVMLSTITKLLVENFVLNLKLNGQDPTKPL
jgi:hypothetical protein